jgi:hypothetical protein
MLALVASEARPQLILVRGDCAPSSHWNVPLVEGTAPFFL